MPPPKSRRWYAHIDWRDGSERGVSPVLPWKLLKTYLDGVLTQGAPNIRQIIIRPAGGAEPPGHSPGSGAESE